MTRKKKIIVLSIFVIIGVSAMLYFNPHSCAKRIVDSLDRGINVEEFEKCVKKNKNGVNSTYFCTGIWHIIDVPNYYPIHYAVKAGDCDKVKILLDNGADANKQDPTVNQSPLMFALRSGKESRFKISQTLIDCGSDVFFEDERGVSIIEEACILTQHDSQEVKIECAEFVKKMITITNYGNTYRTNSPIIINAAAYENEVLLDYIVSNNIDDINATNITGTTPLIAAVRFGYSDAESKVTIKYLLEHGANPHIKDDNGKTAYDYAVENGNTEVAELIKKDME